MERAKVVPRSKPSRLPRTKRGSRSTKCATSAKTVPELPEVETVRRDLAAHVLGRRIERVEIDGARTVRRQSPDRVIDEVRDRKVEALRRKGKFLLIDLEDD